MSRPLEAVDSNDYESLRGSLELALQGDGPAVFPRGSGTNFQALPRTVDSEVALVVETSGSTCQPKRVWHSASSLRAAAEQANAELGGRGVWWKVLPGQYIAGVMVTIRAIFSGGIVIEPRTGETLIESLLRFTQQVEAECPTLPRFTSLVPKQLAELTEVGLQRPSVAEALSSFSRVLVGGQRVPEGIIDAAQDIGVRVTTTYGAAETAGGCVWDGRPMLGTKVEVQQNRIALSGPTVAGGYLDAPERTERSFVTQNGNRWFVSDDIGTLTDGTLAVVGRADRAIVSGGIKTNLDEVEDALQEEYKTIDLAVLAVADDIWGEAIGLISSKNLNPTSAEIFVRARFGKGARLASVAKVPEVPRLWSGKINRPEVERLYRSSAVILGK